MFEYCCGAFFDGLSKILRLGSNKTNLKYLFFWQEFDLIFEYISLSSAASLSSFNALSMLFHELFHFIELDRELDLGDLENFKLRWKILRLARILVLELVWVTDFGLVWVLLTTLVLLYCRKRNCLSCDSEWLVLAQINVCFACLLDVQNWTTSRIWFFRDFCYFESQG